MRCHVCGKVIGERCKNQDGVPVMDGWAWTLAADGSINIATCSDCTSGMRFRVWTAAKPGTPEYDGCVMLAVVGMREERRAAAFAAGSAAVRAWIDEALTPEDRGNRKKAAFAKLYGASDGE